MSSKQYQSKVNVIRKRVNQLSESSQHFRKRVNQLSESSQHFPVLVVNLFCMGSQMLKI